MSANGSWFGLSSGEEMCKSASVIRQCLIPVVDKNLRIHLNGFLIQIVLNDFSVTYH
jgi:hypothetical protein